MISLKKIISERNPSLGEKLAGSLIMAGMVKVDGKVMDKPGMEVSTDALIEITSENPYVSRGGLKIEKAFKELNLSVKGKKSIDIGASTGGFTDFLLKHGSEGVVTVDVGYGILSWKLRQDPRVTVFERTNIRNIDTSKLPYKAEFTVVDVSFISIETIFNKIIEVTGQNGEILILVKPQFEAKKDEVGRGGIVTDSRTHKKVLLKIVNLVHDYRLSIGKITFSKIRGAKGNIEFWVYIKKIYARKVKKVSEDKSLAIIKKTGLNYDKIVSDIVQNAHSFFTKLKKETTAIM